MFRLKNLNILGSKAELAALPEGKLLINTINAHSYNTARKDGLFAEALTNGDVLIPDGVSIVKACRWIKAKSLPKERIAGWDLFEFEMNKLEQLEIRNVSNSPQRTVINAADPDLLWIGMTAPKQEKWTYSHWNELNIHCHVGTIGAVFDFFAGTVERAPIWWQRHGLEWLYRLLKEPKRMWRRYIIGNTLFLWNMLKEKV